MTRSNGSTPCWVLCETPLSSRRMTVPYLCERASKATRGSISGVACVLKGDNGANGASRTGLRGCQPEPGWTNGLPVDTVYMRTWHWNSRKVYRFGPAHPAEERIVARSEAAPRLGTGWRLQEQKRMAAWCTGAKLSCAYTFRVW